MDYEKLYINGEWIPGASGKFIEVENPATREIFARVPAGNGDDVDKAAKAAYAAFPAWAKKQLAERITLMERGRWLLLSAHRHRHSDRIGCHWRS